MRLREIVMAGIFLLGSSFVSARPHYTPLCKTKVTRYEQTFCLLNRYGRFDKGIFKYTVPDSARHETLGLDQNTKEFFVSRRKPLNEYITDSDEDYRWNRYNSVLEGIPGGALKLAIPDGSSHWVVNGKPGRKITPWDKVQIQENFDSIFDRVMVYLHKRDFESWGR